MKKYSVLNVEEILAEQKKSDLFRKIGVASACLIIVLAIASYFTGWLSGITCITMTVVGVLFLRLVLRMKRLRYGKVEQILLDDCDCDKYIRVYEAIRAGSPEKSGLDTISIAKGYFFKGDFQKAKQELSTLKPETLKAGPQVMYYNVAIQNYLELGELQHAKEIRQAIEKYQASQKPGSPAAKLADQLVAYADFADSFRRKDFETARGLQDVIKRNSNHASQMTLLYYRLAVMELEEGKLEDAKEHLEYVVQYGGQIFVRPEAERLLKELNENYTLPVKEEE